MIKLILTFILLCLTFPALAENIPLPLDQFAELPILHDGRLKPLDSFARLELQKFSGKNKNAVAWLAEAIFDPSSAVEKKIFLIESSFSRHSLGLEERQKPLYSYAELVEGLEKTSSMIADLAKIPQKQLKKDQKDLLLVHENAIEFTHLLRSLSSLLPLNITLSKNFRQKANLGKDDSVTFLTLKAISPEIEDRVRTIIKHKGENPAKYSSKERDLVTLGWQYQTIASAGQGNITLRVIPTLQTEDWVSPWELINDGKGSPLTIHWIQDWQKLAKAWQENNRHNWEEVLYGMRERLFYEAPQNYSNAKIELEHLYNQLSPFTVSIFFFAGAMIFGLLRMARFPLSSGFSALFLTIALLIQAGGILTRIYLMGRPPVGTLYESILFVALIAPLVSWMVERKIKNGIGILSGGIAGTFLGLLATSMAGDGDTMKMLGAVLNTQFWLATHVLCITIGYGWCLLTSVLAHIILIGKASGKISQETERNMIESITTNSLFSLLFTTVGTILGGIWADQSWGRFWGWDPKENGALLIVLWLVWLIHGKLAGQLSEKIWIAGMAFLSVIVGVAWVGVNLLGVGLHSYGFIEGVFWGLGMFSALETVILFVLVYILREKRQNSYAN